MVRKGKTMKIKKGDAGYINQRKRNVMIKTILEFGIVLALLFLGIWQTGDRLNLLTVIAILGCLPASKTLVELIMIVPHHSVTKEMADEIQLKGDHLTRVFDMVFTSEKKIMPVESIVISNHTVCGYTSNPKVDANVVSAHVKKYLSANNWGKVSVKIFDHYSNYLKRIGEMNVIAVHDNKEIEESEAAIKRVILSISL